MDKILFSLLFIFFTFTVIANLIRTEISPFFLWNLYAEKYYSQNEYLIYEVRYNNKLLNFKHTWLEARQIMLTDPLKNYIAVVVYRQPDFWSEYLTQKWSKKHPSFKSLIPVLVNQPVQYENFPSWYKRYLSRITNEEIKDISVIRRKVQFGSSGDIRELSADTVLMIQ